MTIRAVKPVTHRDGGTSRSVGIGLAAPQSRERQDVMQPLMPKELPQRHMVNPNRVGIFADNLITILKSLEQHPDTQRIFAVPVLKALVVVADGNDLRIETAIDLPDSQAEIFLDVLDAVIRENSV